MNLPFQIAGRYFLSKKSGLVNVISLISLLSLAVAMASMIVILSVMNGMNSYIIEKFGGFDSDFKIEPVKGKYFEPTDIDRIAKLEGVDLVVKVVEDQALLKYRDYARIVNLKGVEKSFVDVSSMQNFITDGYFDFEEKEYTPISIGYGIFIQMGIALQNGKEPCYIYTVDQDRLYNGFWQNALNASVVFPTGVFSVLPEYDNKYVVAPLLFVQKVFNAGSKVSALEIKSDSLMRKAQRNSLKAKIERIVGDKYTVKNKIEQQQTLYKSMKAEKWMMIAVFVFVLLVSTFTMISSLMLLMHEKRKDIAILAAQGMNYSKIKSIFLTEGLLITITGTLMGVFLGFLIVMGQYYFGWVKFGIGNGGEYVLETYPVAWQWSDMLLVCVVGLGVGLMASLLPLKNINTYKRFNKE